MKNKRKLNSFDLKDSIKVYLYLAVICLIILYVVIQVFGRGIIGVVGMFHTEEITVTITDKDRIVDKNNNSKENKTTSKYIVWGEDENGEIHTFENTDTIFPWKRNSSDVQGDLKIGNTYKLKVRGFRVSLFSMYQNIIGYEEVTKE